MLKLCHRGVLDAIVDFEAPVDKSLLKLEYFRAFHFFAFGDVETFLFFQYRGPVHGFFLQVSLDPFKKVQVEIGAVRTSIKEVS